MLQLITQYYLNARTGSATTEAQVPYYRDPGAELKIDNIKIGTELEGNAVWYHCADDDCYYWSGGFYHTDLSLNNISFSFAEELEIYKSAVNELTGKYRFIPGYKGMAAGLKEIAGQQQSVLALIIYVDKKLPGNEGKIPAIINYRGIPLVTDVRESTGTSMLMSNEADNGSPYLMGGSISEDIAGNTSFGTRTLIVTKNNKDYLLTCYHVACHSLFKREQYSLNTSSITTVLPSAWVSPGKKTFRLSVVEGRFDSDFDYALLEPGDANLFNGMPDVQFKGVYSNQDLIDGFKQGMQLAKYGAATQTGKTGVLRTYHSGQVEVHTQRQLFMSGLIEASHMAESGDSGAPVIDVSNNKLVGFIVAGNTSSTYILPFAKLINQFSIDPKL